MTQLLDLNKSSGLLDLTKNNPSLKSVRGLLNWDVNPIHGASLTKGFDLDIFAFVLNDNGKMDGLLDVVYFRNKTYANGSITIPVDNRTGEGENDEHIDIIFDKVPVNKTKIDVCVILHDASARGQSFGMIANAYFTLTDNDSGVELAKYELSRYTNETAIHIGQFAKVNGSWEFMPSGDVAEANPNDIVSGYMS
jgi:tellurium resistance protein TerD